MEELDLFGNIINQPQEQPKIKKDWVGTKHSTFVTLGASNHTDHERAIADYYATDPIAAQWLLEIEPSIHNIWECACVDGETEYFNGYEWKKIKEYTIKDKVLCYDSQTNSSLLLQPIAFYRKKAIKPLFHFENNSLDMMLSEDHRVVYKHRRNNSLQIKTALEIFDTYSKDSNGFRGKIPTTWVDQGGVEEDENLLRLAVACNADGRTRTKYKKTYEIKVKKERKKQRILMLLNNAQIPYKIFKQKNLIEKGYLGVSFESPLGCKSFPIEWLKLKKNLKEAILDELIYWDGTTNKDGHKVFFTNKKRDAEIIQLIAASIGKSVTILEDNRRKNINYIVSFNTVANKMISKTKKSKLTKEKTEDGFQYCFTVDTGMLILRRKRKIFITGNCGEAHLAQVFAKAGKLNKATDIINRQHPLQTETLDFLKCGITNYKGSIVTNPPYTKGLEFVQHCLYCVAEGELVCMFLKLTFCEGKERRKFFDENPPIRIWVSSSRISCANNGDFKKYQSSAACYAWFIWQKGYKGQTTLKWFN